MLTPPHTRADATPRTWSVDVDVDPLQTVGGTAPNPDENALVDGRFALQGLIRRGGQAEIWAAYDLELDREVVLKRLVHAGARPADWRYRAARNEARLTAAARTHPGILPVLDFVDDQRLGPLLVLPLVADALTLFEAVEARMTGVPPSFCTPEALIDAVRQIAGALGHLHERGLVHGDVHAGNVLLVPSPSGCSALLIDFGLATRIGPEPALRGGAPGTVAPEVAAGTAARAPSRDIYSLGVLLLRVLVDDPAARIRLPAALAGPLDPDPELSALVRACLSANPEDRPSARAVERGLTEHRARVRARIQADQLLATVAEHGAAAEAARISRAQRLGDVERHRAKLAPSPEIESDALRAVWAMEDEIAALQEEEQRQQALIDGVFRSALELVPGYPPAVSGLVRWLTARHAAAERAREPVARELEQRLLRLSGADPALAAYLRGTGRLDLRLGAELCFSVHALTSAGGRVVRPQPAVAVGRGDRVALDLPQGSYLVRLQRPGERREHVYPVEIPRAGLHRAEDDAHREVSITPPLEAQLGADEVWVPPGWHWVGGDPRALGATVALPERVYTPAFVCATAPVRVGEYVSFLQDRLRRGEDVAQLLPFPLRRGPEVSPIQLREDGELRLLPDWDGHEWCLDWPICVIGLDSCWAYAEWIGSRRGGRGRLLRENEWERAVRGADLRLYPWGDHVELGWAWSQELWASSRLARPAAVGTHAVDTSVFGLLDAVGNVACYTPGPELPPDDAPVRVRGGSWISGATQLRIGSRLLVPRSARPASVGLRWARDL